MQLGAYVHFLGALSSQQDLRRSPAASSCVSAKACMMCSYPIHLDALWLLCQQEDTDGIGVISHCMRVVSQAQAMPDRHQLDGVQHLQALIKPPVMLTVMRAMTWLHACLPGKGSQLALQGGQELVPHDLSHPDVCKLGRAVSAQETVCALQPFRLGQRPSLHKCKRFEK